MTTVQHYATIDGEVLAYRTWGEGDPLIVLPGGPGRDADYLEDLGGLADRAGRRLVVIEPRGTGASQALPGSDGPTIATLARDLEDLRIDLGLDALDLLAHSAGAAVAFAYAAEHPDRVRRMVLVAPATRTVGIRPTPEEEGERIRARSDEPWYDSVRLAFSRAELKGFTPEIVRALTPLYYGRWDDRAREHAAAGQFHDHARRAFYEGNATDPQALRASLGRLDGPVRIVIGELDLSPAPAQAAELASVFRDAQILVQDGSGHYPWVDDPARFTDLVAQALAN